MRIEPRLAVLLLLALLLPIQALAGPALLFEAKTGKILYAEDLDDQWHPASLTKIMTAYLTFEALKAGKLKLDQQLHYSEIAAKQPPSKIGMKADSEIQMELALRSLIVKSANDIAVVLAEAIGGSVEGFVKKMNATARRLGMKRTRFVNPNGLPAAGQVTTARDLGKLSRAVMRDFPQYSQYWQLTDMHIGKIRLRSHNDLLKTFEGADGLKTGFICDSGFNIVASATRDGVRLMAVVLGETSSAERNVRAAALLEHGYNIHGWRTFFSDLTIDNAVIAAKARAAASIRSTVKAAACGYRTKAAKARAARRARKRKAKKAANRKAAPAAVASPATKSTK